MDETPDEKWFTRMKMVVFVFLIVLFILIASCVFYKNCKVRYTEEYNRATAMVKEEKRGASSINTKDIFINKPEITPEENEYTDLISSEVTQINKPPVERTVQFGITKDKNENTIVGLYDIEKHNNKYRRYFTYTCSKDNTVVKLDNGQYFGFGLTNDGNRMPIKMISLGLNLYRPDDDKSIKDILLLLNQSDKMSLILGNEQVFVLTIKSKQSTTLPCL